MTCSNLADVSGKNTFLFKLTNFDSDGSEFSRGFPCSNNEAFVRYYNEAHHQKERQSEPTTPPRVLGKKARSPTLAVDTSSDFLSPSKKARVSSMDEEISQHHLGKVTKHECLIHNSTYLMPRLS